MRTSVAAAAVKTPEVFKASSAVAALIAPVCDGKKQGKEQVVLFQTVYTALCTSQA